jgi:hypothetical protein
MGGLIRVLCVVATSRVCVCVCAGFRNVRVIDGSGSPGPRAQCCRQYVLVVPCV